MADDVRGQDGSGSDTSVVHRKMDDMYRLQRHIYDLSRAYYLLGRDQLIAELDLQAVIAGIRRDEEATRAKERVFSPRGENAEWDFRDQPPEFWDQFKTDFAPGTHIRVHPLLHWTELDIWLYIQREGIPLVPLYFAKNGKRYRSLGDMDITNPVNSDADTVEKIIAELRATKVAERSGRAMDHEAEDAFERLRSAGYM